MQSLFLRGFSFVCFLVLPTVVFAQSSPGNIDWETLRPDAEDFSVQMPKGSTTEVTTEAYHKFELKMTTHVAQSANGPVFAVVELSGIKSNPALYTEMERFNSYVDAFKNLFPPKIRKGAVAKLTLVGAKELQRNSGREYRLTVAELSGTAQVYATRKRFYAAVFLSNKKDDETQSAFLSSFLIPERVDPPPAVAVQPAKPAPTAGVQVEGETGEPKPTAAAQPGETGTANSAEAAEGSPHPKRHGPVSGGLLNGKAISLPQPEYPAEAKSAGAAGTVVLRVTIDEQGNVIGAQPISGPPLLQQAAVNAALQAKFSPTLLSGEPVQVVGIITYNFVRQ